MLTERGVRRGATLALSGASVALVLCGAQISARPQPSPSPQASPTTPAPQAVFARYCVTCHDSKLRTAGLALDALDPSNPGANPAVWEKVVAKLRQGSMPPPGRPRPDAA